MKTTVCFKDQTQAIQLERKKLNYEAWNENCKKELWVFVCMTISRTVSLDSLFDHTARISQQWFPTSIPNRFLLCVFYLKGKKFVLSILVWMEFYVKKIGFQKF